MAGVTLGYLKYVLGLDTLQYRKGMTEAERELVTFSKKMEKVGNGMKSIGKGLTAFVTLPAAAFAATSFKVASDAAELQSAFDQTFKGMEASMNAWAEATGDAMGRSTREIQEAANTFGIFFNTALPKGKAAEMSKTFAKLAEDLGSFYNVDTDTAIEKLRSGLAGESEPLRAFGVFLTEAAVKAKAMELGLVGANGALSEQAKIAARGALILEQTKNAQGDVARTASGTANQMRAAAAAFEELQIVVGTKLLPIITPLITKLAEALSWFTSLPVPVQNTALAVVAVSAALGPVLIAFGSLIGLLSKVTLVAQFAAGLTGLAAAEGAAATGATAAGIAVRGLLGPLALAATAVTAVYLAWKNWDRIEPILKRTGAAVQRELGSRLQSQLDGVRAKLKTVGDDFFRLYDRVVGHSYIPDMVDAIGQHMARLDGVMVQPAKAATGAAAEAFRDLQGRVQGLLDTLFPRQAAENQLNRDIADLRAYAAAAKLPVDQLEEAIARLQDRFQQQAPPATNIFGQTDEESTKELLDSLGGATGVVETNLDKILNSTSQWKQVLGQVATDFAGILGNGLAGIIEGTSTLKDLWKEVLGYAIRALTSQNGPLQQLFGGARAAGGPVAGGVPYLVGERGPEIFLPGSSGRILSNRDSQRALGGMGGGMTVNMKVVTPDADSFRRSDRQTARSLGRRLAAAR